MLQGLLERQAVKKFTLSKITVTLAHYLSF